MASDGDVADVAIEKRLRVLEEKIDFLTRNLKFELPAAVAPVASRPLYRPVSEAEATEPQAFAAASTKSNIMPGQLLGFAGIGCLFLAIVLLIRLSIDSGWLTPTRQLALASMFGSMLIAIPYFKQFKFRAYMSQLPALGIAIFHAAIYGGVFYHKILGEDTALLLISGVSILSLALLTKFEYEGYALIAIFGTYLGALFLQPGFPSTISFFGFVLVWNVTYCGYSIFLKERKLILITAYVAIGLLSLKLLGMVESEIEYMKVAAAQAIQFLVFLGAVATYSIANKAPLKSAEAWSFFPLIIFFYGLEYHLINKIDPNSATIFSVVFAGVIFATYKFARQKQDEMLESANVAYTAIAAVFAHSFYFVQFNDETKILMPIAIVAMAIVVRAKVKDTKRFSGAGVVGTLVVFYSFGLLLTGDAHVDRHFLVGAGLIYGVTILLGVGFAERQSQKVQVTGWFTIGLLLAHSQMLLAIYRMGGLLIDLSFVAAIWIVYAFAILAVALKMKDKLLSQTSFPIIVLGLLRFLMIDFSRLDSGLRIVALVGMGALIFIGGYLYKRTVEI